MIEVELRWKSWINKWCKFINH